jgi:tripartite-type tricarboxylate transporter receptor subunit TctC
LISNTDATRIVNTPTADGKDSAFSSAFVFIPAGHSRLVVLFFSESARKAQASDDIEQD